MNGRLLALGGLLVGVLAAVGAWQFLFASGPAPMPVGDEVGLVDDEYPEPPKPDPLNVERMSPVPVEETAPEDTPTQPPPRAPQTDWLIEGRIVGLHADVEWTSELRVVGLPEPEFPTGRRWERLATNITLRVKPDREGRFRFGLSSLKTFDDTSALKITADDPGYLPATTIVELPLVYGRLPDIPQTLTAELTTSPAGLITGKAPIGTRVAVFPPPSEDHRDLPEDLPEQTREALRALGYLEDRAPVVLPVDETKADREGKYSLRIGESGNYVVVALGNPRPCLKHCPGTVFGESVAPDITRADLSEEGPVIEGKVLASFGPLVGSRVNAVRRNFPGPLLAFDDLILHYSQGRLEYRNVSSAADDLGRFVLRGLGQAEYDLNLTEIPIAGTHPDLDQRLRKRVVAPASDVIFDLTGAFVVFRVSTVPWVEDPITVTARRARETCTATTDRHHEAAMFLSPGQTYEVLAERPPFLPTRTSFRFPEDEKVKVQDLTLELPPPGKLKLVLGGPDPWPVRAQMTLDSEWGPAFDKQGEVRLDGGQSIVNQLTPGGYHVTFVPLEGNGPGPWIPLEADVVVRTTETTSCALGVQQGGFLEVEIAAANPGRKSSVYISVSRHDQVIPLIERSDNPGERFARLLLREGTHRLVSPLPVGTLQVYVKGNRVQAQSRDVEIRAGETTQVSFQLEPTVSGSSN